MKILVTGATGFIGKKLFKEAKEQGFDVVGISKNGSAGILPIDITNKGALLKLFSRERFDLVFHLAAQVPGGKKSGDVRDILSCYDVNVTGTVNLIEAGLKSGLKKFVYASSASVYPAHPKVLPVPEEAVCPRNFYGWSKLLGELYLLKYAGSARVSTVVLRYSSVFGPGQKEGSVLPAYLAAAQRGGVLKIFGSGKRSQDFVFVDDAVEATFRAGLEKISGVYNIGSGRETSLSKLANEVIRVVGKGKIEMFPVEGEPADESNFCLNINKAVKGFHYRVKTNLRRGLELMCRG